LCNEILSYSMTNGTSTIGHHVKNCLEKTNSTQKNKTLDVYLSKSSEVKVSADDKRAVTIRCAEFCSFDLRPFQLVKGSGFVSLCQSLIDLGHQFGTARLSKPLAKSLLPDPTNISRTVSQIAEEYRQRLNKLLTDDLQHVNMIGISTDYWKNSGTGDNYLTINIHYTKNEKCLTYMLRTSLFDQSKSGENTRKKILATLASYDIDPGESMVVYVTDNGSNFICGLSECIMI
jgi:hypothetical protein